jgi:secondary thiamine-phosphate synthase enzyme
MPKIEEIRIDTKSRSELFDITAIVQDLVNASKIYSGACRLFVPHTTAGITINENADPSVGRDLLKGLENIAPRCGTYSHAEGNADAHIKSSLVGTDKTVFIDKGRLKLGTWQGIFFCEFDGPRNRRIFAMFSE